MPSGEGCGVEVRRTSTPPMWRWPRRSYWRPLTLPSIRSTTLLQLAPQPLGGVYVPVYGVKSLNWASATVTSQDFPPTGLVTVGAAVTGSCQSVPNSAGTSTGRAAATADAAGLAPDGCAPRRVLARRVAPASMDMKIRLLMAGVLRGVGPARQ